jgi:hypothetical protein
LVNYLDKFVTEHKDVRIVLIHWIDTL